MIYSQVRAQLDQIFARVIETGVSVSQNYPAFDDNTNTIGKIGGTSIALKNISYNHIYAELEQHNKYHIKLPDGGLLIFQYTFDAERVLTKHRLGYFPSPRLPTIEEAPELYERDELYGDILLERVVRFPIRFDFDPDNHKPRYHPKSHLTLGQFDNCRIPVVSAVSPNIFLTFILQNFYFLLYRRHQNMFEKKIAFCEKRVCLTEYEATSPHFFF